MEVYCKTVHIEALTMLDIVKKYIVPSSYSYQNELLGLYTAKKNSNFPVTVEEKLINKLSTLTASLMAKTEALEDSIVEVKSITDTLENAQYYRNSIFTHMNEIRLVVDELETIIAQKHWVFPYYSDLLYSVD